jgi:homoserine dehydrogenase
MGGLEPAGEVVDSCLRRGVPVVTANKHLLAERGAELEQRSRSTGAALRFEAAVGGGTPVVGLLATDLAALRIERVRGVVNGTTNWILDAMEQRGLTAGEALEAAQSAGYAEADPALDVDGHDAAHKLVILARLAFGRWLRPAAIVRMAHQPPGAGRPGIAGVTSDEVCTAARRGERIRLVAEAAMDPSLPGGLIEASVLPRSLPLEDPLAGAHGVGNVIELYGQPLGRMTVSGPGAGGPATAAAVLGDLIALALGAGSSWAGLPSAQ